MNVGGPTVGRPARPLDVPRPIRADFAGPRCHDGAKERGDGHVGPGRRTPHDPYVPRPTRPRRDGGARARGRGRHREVDALARGVEVARERGLRVLSSGRPRSSSGLPMPAWATCSRVRSGMCGLDGCSTASCARDRPALREDRRAGRLPHPCVAVRTALKLLAEREPVLVAVDDVQWLDAPSASVLAFSLRRLAGEDIRAPACTQARGRRAPGSEVDLAVADTRIARLRVGPLSAGAFQAILQPRLGRVFPRPTFLRLHEASGGNPFFAIELARALGDDVDPTAALPLPECSERSSRSPRRAPGQAASSAVARVHARSHSSPDRLKIAHSSRRSRPG